MNKAISRKELRQAARILMESMLDNIPKNLEYSFSEGFQEKARAQIQRAIRLQIITRWKKALKAAVVFMVLGSSLLLAISPTVRASITGWIRECIEDTYSYFFSEPVAAIPQDWELGWIPEGYEVIYDESTTTGRTVLYQNEDQFITFTYTWLEENNQANVFTFDDEYTVTTVQTADKTCDLYISQTGNDTNALVWMDTHTGTVFIITAYLEEAQMLRLIENLLSKP